MQERNLARELGMLATEVDSVAKALVQARAELAGEAARRRQADAQAEELRQQLRHARRRAKAAERGLVKVTAAAEADAHDAETRERELRVQLEQAQGVSNVLRHELEQNERQRRALEENLAEVMENLRQAAREARAANRTGVEGPTDEATLVPVRPDAGW